MVKPFAIAFGLAMMFCGEAGSEDVDAGAGADDGGRPVLFDDAGIDASTDGGPPSFDAGPSIVAEYDSADPAACFDGEDNDARDGVDCGDRSCRANIAACCVGAGAAECCVDGVEQPLEIAGCGGSVNGCATLMAQAAPFGSPTPEILTLVEDGAPSFVPRGDVNDSGLLFHEVVDTNGAAVTLRARIAATMGGHTAGNDVVAFGLADVASTTGLLRVEPVVALLVSGNRAQISLVVAGEIVFSTSVPDGEFHEYALEVRPGGSITLERDGVDLETATLTIDRPLRPVLYGRTFNPSPTSPLPVRAQSIRITADVCDVPSALAAPTAPVALSSGPTWDAITNVQGPSVAQWTDTDGAHDRMAIEIDNALYLAERQGDSYVLSSAIGDEALVVEEEWAEERLADPVLRWTGTELELWFTGWANGLASVGRVRAAPGTDTFVWDDVEVIIDDPADVTTYQQPAPFSAGGVDYLVVRETGPSGDRLLLYAESDGTWMEEAMLRAPSPTDLFAFDRDEIGAPSVIYAGGAYRLFFAGRRGSRWSIGLLVSADGRNWSAPQDSALVYEGSGSGFDALGARDPEPVVEGGILRLYYAGIDGTRTRLGMALGVAPPIR